ncbi:hypothetical protein HA466_0257290 [Hirschfeldia incana]|nr:hypothetical protein HA466_0257290 [Hirschfeldia incana]
MSSSLGLMAPTSSIKCLMRSITSVKRLTICSEMCYSGGFVFNQLEHLKLCVCAGDSSNLLARLLEDSPNLRVLDIFEIDHNDRGAWDDNPTTNLTVRENSEDYELKSLRRFLDLNLPLHRAQIIESFHLKIYDSFFNPRDVKLWLVAVLSRHLRKLKITYCDSHNPDMLPSSLYSVRIPRGLAEFLLRLWLIWRRHMLILDTFISPVQFLYGDGLVFNQLEHLKLCVHTRKSSNLLTRLLEYSPNLRVLDIFEMDHFDTHWAKPPTSVHESVLSSLQAYNWSRYFKRRPQGMDLAVYILGEKWSPNDCNNLLMHAFWW